MLRGFIFGLALMAAGTVPAQTGVDARQALAVSADEARFVLEEMRGLLVASEAVLSAAVAGDMKAVAAAARKAGMKESAPPPPGLPARLPAAFRQLGAQTHQGFDQLALDAGSMGDRELALRTLSANMKRCVACHAAYRLDVSAARPAQ